MNLYIYPRLIPLLQIPVIQISRCTKKLCIQLGPRMSERPAMYRVRPYFEIKKIKLPDCMYPLKMLHQLPSLSPPSQEVSKMTRDDVHAWACICVCVCVCLFGARDISSPSHAQSVTSSLTYIEERQDRMLTQLGILQAKVTALGEKLGVSYTDAIKPKEVCSSVQLSEIMTAHVLITCSSCAYHMLLMCLSHAPHVLITCSSCAYHMLLMCLSHAPHVLITCSSCAYHMLLMCLSHAPHVLITCSSCAYHMLLMCLSHAPHVLITCSSCAYHMLLMCLSHAPHVLITCSSCAYHMLLMCLSHAPHVLITCSSCAYHMLLMCLSHAPHVIFTSSVYACAYHMLLCAPMCLSHAPLYTHVLFTCSSHAGAQSPQENFSIYFSCPYDPHWLIPIADPTLAGTYS